MTHADMVTLLSAVIVGGFTVVVALINRVHRLVNSRMTELLALTRAASKAEGIKQGHLDAVEMIAPIRKDS